MEDGHFDYSRLNRKCHLCLYRIKIRVLPRELFPNTGMFLASSNASLSQPCITIVLLHLIRPCPSYGSYTMQAHGSSLCG